MAQPLSIVDSHVHLWDPARFRMPWLDDIDALRKPFDWPEFSAASAGTAVEGIVYVQVDTTPAYGLLEARWAAAQPSVGAIVGWAPVDDGEIARTYLDALIDVSPRIRGVRRLIQSEPDPAIVLERGFLDGVRLLPEYGLSFDICIRYQQMPAIVQMVRACPETSFILDHVGKPDIRNGVLEPWREQLSCLAAFPNVVCKVSGIVTEANVGGWTSGDIEPYVHHALNVFGEDRVLFGGDWPVVTLAASYQRWVDTLTELTAGLSAEAAEKLWRSNARRVYRMD
jgi:L-fuconolactonase